jgi:hypothetical protein
MGSLHELLSGAIDYAGLFPPATLELEAAWENHCRYRTGPLAWLLGRFVLPASRLGDLGQQNGTGDNGPLAVIVPGAAECDVALARLDEALALMNEFPVPEAVDTLELRWPQELVSKGDGAALAGFVQAVSSAVLTARLRPCILYFELPPPSSSLPEVAWRNALACGIAALADYQTSAREPRCPAGFKFRTGGRATADVPSSAELAVVICACRDAGVFWKATAGLHHALTHFDPALSAKAIGFLNVLSAVVLADVHGLSAKVVQEILDDADAARFRFDGDALVWRDLSVPADKIAVARRQSLRSFGSCSFDEPCRDLQMLGLL